MNKLWRILIAAVSLLPVGARAVDLGVVSTADYLRFPVIAVDSSGLEQSPDSGHVLVWYEGEGTANSVSYAARWIETGASGSYVDSTRYGGHDYYYFVDQVADIDNGEGNGVYAGAVVLFTDGQPFPNQFTFTLAGDELADYWAAVETNLDATVSSRSSHTAANIYSEFISGANEDVFKATGFATHSATDVWNVPFGTVFTAASIGDSLNNASYVQGSAAGLDSTAVARAVWNAPSSNHTGSGRFGANLDVPVSGISGGSGAFSVTVVAVDTALDQTVSGVRLAIRNSDQTSLLALASTGSTGTAPVSLDAGAYLVTASAPGYIFEAFHTLSFVGSTTDSIFGYQFHPGSPEIPVLCRVYGYLFKPTGEAESGATISVHLPAGVSRASGLIISPYPTQATVSDDGFFYLDLLPSTSLTGSPRYEFTISRTDGTILRKRLRVPNALNWQLTW